MRTKKVIRDTGWALLLQFVTILFAFLIPRFVILEYGSQVNGLTSTINQLLNTFNLIQAGAAGAAIFALYKPFVNYDYDKISKVVTESKKFFIKAGFIFLGLTVLASPIIAHFIKTEISFAIILASFLIMGIKYSLDFFLTSKYRIVFGANQRNFIVSIASMIEIIVYYSLVFILIYYHIHFIFMYVGLFIGSVLKIIILEISYRKLYGNKIYFNKSDKQIKIHSQSYVFWTEITFNIVVSMPIIIISLLENLKAASVFAIYSIVLNMLIVATSSVYNSIKSGFGNLVASEDINKVNEVFNKFQFILFTFCSWLYMTAAFLIEPFITVYTHGIEDTNYSNPLLAVLIICNGALNSLRVPYNIIVSSFGLFKETYMQLIISCIISILISTILGLVNISLVLLGPIFFYLSNLIYQHYKIKKIIPDFDNSKLYSRSLVMVISIAFSFAVYYVIAPNILSLQEWVILAVAVSLINFLFIMVITMITDRVTVRESIKYIYDVLRRLSKR